MVRMAREVSPTGAYHVMVRGINKQAVFNAEAEKAEYLRRVDAAKARLGISLIAYCVMDNHAHLLLIEDLEHPTLSAFMQQVNTGYAMWYNQQYHRVGYLFQGRYRSEAIKNEQHLLSVVRYIHQNPVRIGRTLDYWTSYADYLGGSGITDTGLLLGMFAFEKTKARSAFVSFVSQEVAARHLDTEDTETKEERVQRKRHNVPPVSIPDGATNTFSLLEPEQQSNRLKELRTAGYTLRQIQDATGIPRSTILDRTNA